MEIIRKASELKDVIKSLKAQGKSVGFVPTMGALHAGHISLIEGAHRCCDVVVVSVFVNPTQFNNPNDLQTYPRTEEADRKALDAAGVDVAFFPTVEEIYPVPDTRVFDLGRVGEVMEGAMRPGHFNGVAQVVSRLFDLVEPNKAFFGEKDFQQIAVIRRMVELEGFDVEIVACPIKREADGLAMSSRNVRLTSAQRAKAPLIHATLLESASDKTANIPLREVKQKVVDSLNVLPEMEVEYFEIVDGLTLEPIKEWDESSLPVGCITVYVGDVRLIDNISYNN